MEALPVRTPMKTPSPGIRRALLALLLTLTWLGTPALAETNAEQLSQRIVDLQREGSVDQALQLLADQGQVLTPADRLHFIAETHEMRYQQRDLAEAERMASLTAAVDAYRQLLRDHRNDYRRVIWQVDFATLVVFGELGIRAQEAAFFYDLGLPSQDQREAFETLVPEAFGHVAEAELLLFELEGTLPRRPDFQDRFIATGLWDRINNEYGAVRLPLLQGLLAYYTSLLPEDHRYFQTLGRNVQVVRQQRVPDRERTRLRTLAVTRLRQYVEDEQDRFRLRNFARPIYARVLLRLERFPEARQQAEATVALGRNDLNDLSSRIVLAIVAGQTGQVQQAVEAFEQLAAHPLAVENLLYRLLITDAEHRWRMTRVAGAGSEEEKRRLTAQAFRIYDRVMDDPEIPAEQRQALRNFIYDRWARAMTDDVDPATLPDLVLLAVGQFQLAQGRIGLAEAAQASADEREAAVEAARRKLNRSIEMHQLALKSPDISPADRAQCFFNIGLARFELAPRRDLNAVLTTVAEWRQVLDDPEMRQAGIALDAARYSLGLLRDLYYVDVNNVPENLAEQYLHVANLLFTHFPNLEITHDERKVFGFYIHQVRGEYAEAIAIYEPLPVNHRDFWWVRREMVFSLLRVVEQLEAAAAPTREITEARERLVTVAGELRQQAQAALPRATARRAEEIRQADAEAMLAMAEAFGRDGQWARARSAMENWERVVGEDLELRRRSLEQVIVIYVQTEAMEQAVQAGRELLGGAGGRPEESLAVVEELLGRLTQRMESADQAERDYAQQIREQRGNIAQISALRAVHERERTAYARATSAFAELLLDFQRAQGKTEEQLFVLELTQARALRFKGELVESIRRFEELHRVDDNNLDVIIELAESHWAMARLLQERDPAQVGQRVTVDDRPMTREEHLSRAFQLFDRLVLSGRGRAMNDDHGLFPNYYWLGHLRRLEITLDRGSQTRDQLLRSIRQLQIEAVTQKLNEDLAQVEARLTDPDLAESARDMLQSRKTELLRELAAPLSERVSNWWGRLQSQDMGGYRREFVRIESAVLRMSP